MRKFITARGGFRRASMKPLHMRVRRPRLCIFAFISAVLLLLVLCAVPVLAAPEISASSAVVIDAATGIVLFEHNKDERNYPASTTKIMTALLAVENGKNDRVWFSHDAVYGIEWNSSNIAMNEGESLSLDDALYGLLLESANEVANALAESNEGSTEAFAERMTARAAELGAVNTSFKNAHGLHDEEHYTTAYDMALIMREVVKNPKLVDIISTRRHDIMPTELQPEIRILNNTNRMIQPHTQYFNEWIVGGKTGFTDEARHTLVTYANQGGIGLITAVMRGESGEPYNDTAALIELGFEQFADLEIFNPGEYEGRAPVTQIINGEPMRIGMARLAADRAVTRHLPKNAGEYITLEPLLPRSLSAPVAKGARLGELQIYCNGVFQEAVSLFTVNAIEAFDILPEPQEQIAVAASGSEKNTRFIAVILLLALTAATVFLLGLRASRR